MATAAPDRLHFTDSDEANELLVREPLALLIGFALDQQVSVQKAFSGPLELERRLGRRLDAREIAAMHPSALEEICRRKPAIHRYPGAMAQRIHELCAHVAEEYGGDAERIWTEARDGAELERRLRAFPGFGDMKVRSLIAVVGKLLGVRPPGWEDVTPKHPTLGDVDSAEALAAYQEQKRAYKASLRAGTQSPPT